MTQPEYSTDAERAAAIAGYVAGERFPRGDLAALRRMAPGANPAPAFYRIAARFGLFGPPPREAAWALVIHGIALMTSTTGTNRSAHSPGIPVGRALYRGATGGERASYSENRLDRLLAARGAVLESLIARLCRTLGREGVTFDWREMATFILMAGGPHGETARGRIALNYYGAEVHAEAQSTQDKENSA